LLRSATALAVSLLLLATSGAPPAAAAEPGLEQARADANALAAEVAAAQHDLAELEAEAATVTATASAATAKLQSLEAVVQDQAVERFIHGGGNATGTAALLLTGEEIGTATRAEALARSVSVDTAAVLEDYRATAEDLEAAEQRLAELRAATDEALIEVRSRADAAAAELERQVQVEAAEQAAVQARREAAAGSRGQASPVAPAPREVVAAAGTASGGFLCPVAGARAFTNDWGMARSGGRRHQGTDILSPRGTPVVASVSGVVRGHSSSLGGVSYYLEGDDGNTYFGTHLASLSGASGRVSQGTVLGSVGNSGNARGGPTHLHFEVHAGGGSPTNPYPLLSRAC
jgi:murein DD-endopeptidase MepM/ murein hydrolase activator NlpD